MSVLLLGATGETGGDILEGLIEDGTLDITCLIRPESANKPSVQALKDRNIKTVVADLNGSIEDLAKVLSDYDTVISTIGADDQLQQLALVDAAVKAGVKRFVPCGFTTVCPPTGVMILREEKEVVYNKILEQHLPFTIVDVGYWHQLSFPRVPSGKTDYAAVWAGKYKIFSGGNAPTLLTDKRDMGHFVARIIKDKRTLNKKVFTHSDVLTQNEIIAIMEEASGEKIEADHVSSAQLLEQVEAAKRDLADDPKHPLKRRAAYTTQYNLSKFIRCDNTPEMAEYLGYLDARELYPDFKPISFKEYVGELLDGKGKAPYVGVKF